MLGDGHPNSGTKGSWFKFQWGVLKLLEAIAAGGVGDASAANQVLEIAAINNLGKTEDSPHVTGDTGVMALAVRNDAGLPLAADGDYIPITTDATGAVRTTSVGGSGGIAQPDKSAFVEGFTSFNPIGGVFNDAPAGDPAEDEAAAARITAKRALHVNLRDSAGVEIGTLAAPVRIDPTGTTTQPISAVNLDIRDLVFATDKVDVSGSTGVGVTGTFFQATQPVSGPLTDAELRATPVPVSGTVTATPSGTQDTNIIQVGGAAIAIGQADMVASMPVVIAADQSPILVTNTPSISEVGSHSNVASSATNVTLLATNASRKGATVFNDSTQVLYLKLAASASTTSYTVQLASLGYYEVPFQYTGIIDGLWAAANGSARLVEFV